ncbi:MAG TPA: D-alanyl-D-alanine carboxypeptidase family protein [Xanthobacteraceae bacterium]|nr:D-alanyl-D-alanine carboxypeptidase family protein [Xanthobacteraceae bacterium]
MAITASAAVALGATAAAAGPEAALLIDADSGRVLYAENATTPWYPASVTKIMTAYVTLKAVKEGRISMDKLLTVSENAAAQQPAKMGFQPGTTLTVENALKMMMVKSANDMAVVLAEGVSGSIENFATEMNRTAARLGMTQTSYVNPNGLPADGQITSARDLAILARAAIRDLPEYELYWHISAIKFGRRVMRNYNTLIDRYPGADGMKTGFICASGFNLVATATRGGRRLIAVVLGSRSGMQRAEKAAQLLERGFTGGGGLSWLIPAFGTVDGLQPIDAAPPNLRDDICNAKGRRRPPSDAEAATTQAEESTSSLAMMAGFQLGPPRAGLIGPLQPSMAPIVVYTGPVKSPAALEQLASAPDRETKKRAKKSGTQAASTQAAPDAAPKPAAKPGAKPAAKTAAKPASGDAKVAPAKPAAAKPASAEPAAKPKPKPKPKPVAATQSKQ